MCGISHLAVVHINIIYYTIYYAKLFFPLAHQIFLRSFKMYRNAYVTMVE
jgi:hypothetical protein